MLSYVGKVLRTLWPWCRGDARVVAWSAEAQIVEFDCGSHDTVVEWRLETRESSVLYLPEGTTALRFRSGRLQLRVDGKWRDA